MILVFPIQITPGIAEILENPHPNVRPYRGLLCQMIPEHDKGSATPPKHHHASLTFEAG
jgi:hypothetical protein